MCDAHFLKRWQQLMHCKLHYVGLRAGQVQAALHKLMRLATHQQPLVWVQPCVMHFVAHQHSPALQEGGIEGVSLPGALAAVGALKVALREAEGLTWAGSCFAFTLYTPTAPSSPKSVASWCLLPGALAAVGALQVATRRLSSECRPAYEEEVCTSMFPPLPT